MSAASRKNRRVFILGQLRLAVLGCLFAGRGQVWQVSNDTLERLVASTGRMQAAAPQDRSLRVGSWTFQLKGFLFALVWDVCVWAPFSPSFGCFVFLRFFACSVWFFTGSF